MNEQGSWWFTMNYRFGLLFKQYAVTYYSSLIFSKFMLHMEFLENKLILHLQ